MRAINNYYQHLVPECTIECMLSPSSPTLILFPILLFLIIYTVLMQFGAEYFAMIGDPILRTRACDWLIQHEQDPPESIFSIDNSNWIELPDWEYSFAALGTLLTYI